MHSHTSVVRFLAAPQPSNKLPETPVILMTTISRLHVLWMSIALAFAGGFMDAVTFLFVGGVFSSMMTGNLMVMGIGLVAPGTFLKPDYNIVAIAAFVAGVALAALLPAWNRRGQIKASIEAVLLAVATYSLLLSGPPAIFMKGTPLSPYVALAVVCAAGAMGIQSTLVSRIVSVPVSTTYMTGTLIRIVSDLAGRTADTVGHAPRYNSDNPKEGSVSGNRILLPILSGFLAGAMAAAFLVPLSGYLVVLIPVILLLLVAAGWKEEFGGEKAV